MPIWWVMMNLDTNEPRYIEYRKRGVQTPKVYFHSYDTGDDYIYEAFVYETATKRIRILAQRQGEWIFRASYEMYLDEYNPWVICLSRLIHPLIINQRG